MKEFTVGKLRQQTALAPAYERIVLVVRDPETGRLKPSDMRVVGCYPDTTDEHGNWRSTFKIEVSEVSSEEKPSQPSDGTRSVVDAMPS